MVNRSGDDYHWKGSLLFSQIPKEGNAPGHAGPHGEAPGSGRRQEAEGERGTVGKSTYCGFLKKEQMRQGKQASDWLV